MFGLVLVTLELAVTKAVDAYLAEKKDVDQQRDEARQVSASTNTESGRGPSASDNSTTATATTTTATTTATTNTPRIEGNPSSSVELTTGSTADTPEHATKEEGEKAEGEEGEGEGEGEGDKTYKRKVSYSTADEQRIINEISQEQLALVSCLQGFAESLQLRTLHNTMGLYGVKWCIELCMEVNAKFTVAKILQNPEYTSRDKAWIN